MDTETKRVEYLDSIRGLAALFVLLCHTTKAFDWPPAYWTLINWPFIYILFDGKAAVVMFFVLSGYVLSKPYVTSADTPPQNFPANLLSPSLHPNLDSLVFCLCCQHIEVLAINLGHRLTKKIQSRFQR
jgi:hypothetical protein